jgi:hypothetical protein
LLQEASELLRHLRIEDVTSLLKGCKCIGCWKVYGDEQKARTAFDRFKKCAAVYLRKWQSGVPLEKLTVAV